MKIRRFSPKQKQVMGWWVPGSPHEERDGIICDGAVRSGKTLCMGLSFTLWAMSGFSGQQFAFCGKTALSLRRNLMQELLPLLDNLQRALDTPCADENYLTGIKMIQTGFEEYLKKMGVETFGKAGEPFDPNLHNAVMHIEDESLGKNVVAQVFQSGYRRGDRILRHAMVQQAN